MSLLMDALKRAEKARQAEAERAKSAGSAPDSSPLSLDPIDEPSDERAREPVPPPRQAPAREDTDDSLELTPAEVRREIDAMPDPEIDGVSPEWNDEEGSADTPERDAERALSLEYGDIPLDETGSTLPSMRAAQRSVQDYFDGTHSVSMSMEDVQGAIEQERASAPEPAPELGATTMDGDTTSRRRAQAVLDARAVAPSGLGRTIALVVVLVLILGGVGGGAFLFKDRILAMIDGQSTVLARRPPAPAPRPAAVAGTPRTEPAKPAEQVLAADEREALLRAAAAAREEESRLAQAAPAAPPASAAADTAPPAAGTEAATAGTAQAPSPEPAVAGNAAASVASGPSAAAAADRPEQEVPLADVLRGMNDARAPEVASSAGLRITHHKRPSRTHATLVQAFDAFQRGDNGEAMTAYQAVLARDPKNRNALLGAAAVFMRGGALQQAAGYYARVLRLNPRDSAAQAGMIALREDLDPVSGESLVKRLLLDNPDDANLHFTLGNLYAEQQRWPEAQQAYFEAYRLDSANPDLAFNLAVSLDRLSQGKAAVAYYRRAMDLAGQHPAAFDPSAAARRVSVLGGS